LLARVNVNACTIGDGGYTTSGQVTQSAFSKMKRLQERVQRVVSEDVGIADSNVVVQVKTLHDLYAAHKKAKKEGGEDKLWFVHAVLILVRAPKTRIVDHALITYFEGDREPVEIPDYALDVHTSTGRAMGRGNTHFFEHGAVLEPSAERHFMPMYDPYLERAKTIRCRKRP